jgi:hypothetical protein
MGDPRFQWRIAGATRLLSVGRPEGPPSLERIESQEIALMCRLHSRRACLASALAIDGLLPNEQLVLRRDGPQIAMKIQAEDRAQGGTFQMEPSRSIPYYHELAPAFRFGRDALGRVVYIDGAFVGSESPQAATLAALTDFAVRGDVRAGGRMGIVPGEDALQT